MFHSGAVSTASFSGGTCANCGVAVDAIHNEAVIGLSTGPGLAGFQFIDLSTSPPSLGPVLPTLSSHGEISENILIDNNRRIVLSASEAGTYEIVDFSSGFNNPVFYEFTSPSITLPGSMDSSSADCATGLVFAPIEFSNPSEVVIADVTQAIFTSGSPGTWTAPAVIFSLSESTLAAGASGIAIDSNSHIGIITGEFGGNMVTAMRLPAVSGNGTTPTILDWVSCGIPSGFQEGYDPHAVTIFHVPGNNVTALLYSPQNNQVALIDLVAMLDPTVLPRTTAGHGCATISQLLPPSVCTVYST